MLSGLCAGGGFFNPFNLEIKQIANTNVLHWAGRTFALHEVMMLPACDAWSLTCLWNCGDWLQITAHADGSDSFRQSANFLLWLRGLQRDLTSFQCC